MKLKNSIEVEIEANGMYCQDYTCKFNEGDSYIGRYCVLFGENLLHEFDGLLRCKQCLEKFPLPGDSNENKKQN